MNKLFLVHTLFKRLYLWRRICHCYADEEKFVDEYHWIDEEEMLDLTAIAQSSPGAIAVNAALIVGYRVAGVAGLLLPL